jgi:predicted metal-dependent hydrolase
MKGVNCQELRRGIELFNRGEFFEAHEVLEDVWRAASLDHKKFLQGIVQLAVAFHHRSTGNLVGMRSVMERGIKNITDHPTDCCGLQVSKLKKSFAKWREAMDNGAEFTEAPHINLRD